MGPGTGYFLEHPGLAPGSRVTILDPNPNVLRHVSRRLRSFDLTAVEADVLKPLPVAGPFESAALNLVIHCLPGPLERKARAVANVAAVLAPTGVLFGASVLGRSGRHNRVARAFLTAFNRQGGFDNLDDTEDGLREILPASFEHVELQDDRIRGACSRRGTRGSVPRLPDGIAVRGGTIPSCRPRRSISPCASTAAPRTSTSTPRIPRTSRPGRRGSARSIERVGDERYVGIGDGRVRRGASRPPTRSASSTTR